MRLPILGMPTLLLAPPRHQPTWPDDNLVNPQAHKPAVLELNSRSSSWQAAGSRSWGQLITGANRLQAQACAQQRVCSTQEAADAQAGRSPAAAGSAVQSSAVWSPTAEGLRSRATC